MDPTCSQLRSDGSLQWPKIMTTISPHLLFTLFLHNNQDYFYKTFLTLNFCFWVIFFFFLKSKNLYLHTLKKETKGLNVLPKDTRARIWNQTLDHQVRNHIPRPLLYCTSSTKSTFSLWNPSTAETSKQKKILKSGLDSRLFFPSVIYSRHTVQTNTFLPLRWPRVNTGFIWRLPI